jgi:hypothetical protein
MKKILFILLFFITISLSAQPYVYYVAPTGGSDENAGTNIDAPWATWQKAFNTADKGDTVYFRGGTWTPVAKAGGLKNVTAINPSLGYGNSGTWDSLIVFMAYPGEVPVLDCSDASDDSHYGNGGLGIGGGATNIKIKGLTICNAFMLDPDLDEGGRENCGNITASEVGNIYFENVTSHSSGGPGFWGRTYDTISVINCDSYSNCDSLDGGGGGDGFALSSRGTAADTFKLTIVTGSRSWNNSDDGWDIGSTKQVQFYNNWSFGNGGNSALIHGDGAGLKLSYSTTAMLEKRKVFNNIIAYNIAGDSSQGAGISEVNLYDETIYGPVADIFNNTIYKNYGGFMSSLSWGWANYPTNYYNDVLTNNIIHEYDYTYPATFKAINYRVGDPPYVTLTINTFYRDPGIGDSGNCTPNPSFTLSDADFKALPTDRDNCIDILSASRQSDGSLPDIGDYFKLAEDSDLKSAGTDVGMTATPDLGVDWAYLGLGTDSTLKYILTYSFAEQTGAATIDTSAKTVDIEVEYGTTVTALVATFTLSTGATAAVGVTPQVSGTTENDFTSPVTYVVTALDESTENWTVTVTIDDSPNAPTVTTTAITSYNARHATLGGNVVSDGGGTLTARGICYSTSENPTTSDNIIAFTPATGSYSIKLTTLQSGTTYHVRAYATNESGTSYGSDQSFTTDARTYLKIGNGINYYIE